MVALVVLSGTALVVWSHYGNELFPVNRGTGHDGRGYAWMAQRGPSYVFGQNLDSHRIQRIVPSLVAFAVLKLLNVSPTFPTIILTFQMLNYAMIACSAVLWWQAARQLALGRPAGWVGFLALFVNYAVLKFPAYYPVLTDSAGFFLGTVTLWCLLTGRRSWLPLVAVVGAFTWPTVAYSALLLYALSRPSGPLRPIRRWGAIAAVLLATGVTALSWRGYRCESDCTSQILTNGMLPGVVPLSLIIVFLFVFLATRPLLELLTVRVVFQSFDWPRFLVAVTLLTVLGFVQRQLSVEGSTVSRTLMNTAVGGIIKPGGFLVAHSIYFGVAVPLLVLTWRRAVRTATDHGIALIALLLVYVLLSLSAESRILVNQWPFFVLLAASVVDRLTWRRRQVVLFAAGALVMSRVWFPVTQGQWTGEIRQYPDQFYGMSIGFNMTVTSYLIMTALTVAGGATMWWALRMARPGPAEPTPPVAVAEERPNDLRECRD